MAVGREDDVDEIESLGGDHATRHPHVRRLGLRVLPRQRVREVRVDEEVAAVVLDEETALAEPPDVHAGQVPRRLDVGEEGVVREERLDQRAYSSRTIRTPATRFASFARAAQRAVWLSPQSVETASRSGGAKRRKCRTRSATSSGGST